MSKLRKIADNIKNNKFDEALKQCNSLDDKNDKHIIYNFKGVIHLIKGNLEESEKNFLNSLKIKSDYKDPIKNLYLVYLKKKNFKDLLFYAKKLTEIDKFNNEYNYQLAYAFELNNNLDEARKYYELYLEQNGNNKKKALNNIGCIYLKRNKPKIALKFFLKAIELGEDKIIINNIFNCYVLLRDLTNSEIFYIKAQKIDDTFIEFKHTKAKYLILHNKIDEALEVLNENKDKPNFLITLLILYFNLGENELGKKLLKDTKHKMEKDPDFFNYYGLKLLYEGNFDTGWKFYEFRNSKTIGNKQNNKFKNVKEWSGEKIVNKHIVVIYEQGLGDSIQFSKYLIPLTKIAEEVTFIVQDNIRNLFKKNIKNLSIKTIDEHTNVKYDYKITLGSLIKFFYKEKIKFQDIIIQSDKELDLKWKKKISKSKFNIGLTWSGSFNGVNEPYRSIPLQTFKDFFSLESNFYCLQSEVWSRDLEYFKSFNFIDCGKYRLNEIASIIQNLDLIITTDTSILHLSASLGKETWGIISLYPDWRWGEFNKFNPYSNLKIFKQKKFNDWFDVKDSLLNELKIKIKNYKK